MVRRSAGFSILELILIVAVIGVLGTIGYAAFPREGFALNQAAEGLISDSRLARSEAISGARYVRLAMEPAQNRYRILEITWTSGSWTEVAEVKTVSLGDRRTERVTLSTDSNFDLIFDPRGNPIGLGPQDVVFTAPSGRTVTVSLSQQGMASI